MTTPRSPPARSCNPKKTFTGRIPAYPTGCAICEVEIDPDTGAISIPRYGSIDDAGQAINPLILHGQVHGGIVQGIGQALVEDVRYDESGQVLSGSFMDYGIPRAHLVPSFDIALTEDPTKGNPLRVKGGGEAGITPALAVVMNAIMDALKDSASSTWTCRRRRIASGGDPGGKARSAGLTRRDRRRIIRTKYASRRTHHEHPGRPRRRLVESKKKLDERHLSAQRLVLRGLVRDARRRRRPRPHHPEGAGGAVPQGNGRSRRSRTAARTASRRSAWARSSAATASSAPITAWSSTRPAPACCNPHGNKNIPSRAKVKSYPVVEKHKAIWVWMGDQPADPAKVPDFSVMDNVPELHTTKRDKIMVKANYELVVDNLLDLSPHLVPARGHPRQRRHGGKRDHRRARRQRHRRRRATPATPSRPG